MSKNPELSIISVNYNGLEHTLQMIKSIKDNLSEIDYEIIVVDNASKESCKKVINSLFKDVIVIQSNINLGFAGGNNLAIKSSKGDFVFLLNNDTFIEDNSIINLIKRLRSSDKIGAVSPKIRFSWGTRTIQFAGYTKLSSITMRNQIIGYNMDDNYNFNTAQSSSYLHGAALMVKRQVIEKVGLMPQIYFLYYEELDWCQKMIDAGYELWYEPNSTVFHKESCATGQNSTFKLYYITRNRLLFAYRNRKGLIRFLSILYQMAVILIKSLLYLLKAKGKYAFNMLKAGYDFIRLENKLEANAPLNS